jgi:cellulose synthase/poly-beta-1,6-N-acetylglucosamine synthase-like glycosyltransferase
VRVAKQKSDLVRSPHARVNCPRLSILVFAAGLIALAALVVIAYLAWLALPSASSLSAEHSASLDILIVVPVFDEAPLIIGKLTNLSNLSYPRRRVIIVDGGSTDGTADEVAKWTRLHPGFELLRTSHRNKTAQISAALELHTDAQWILITDADAELQRDALERLIEVVDPHVGVVGARVRPRDAHVLESLHWRFAEWLRERERRRGSASIVTAPCYLSRRELIGDLPADTVADDVHVSCRAMEAGQRIEVAVTSVLELRSPRSLWMLIRHKHRKAGAYLREVFRFLPRVGSMPSPMGAIFLWRAVLMTIVPLASTIGGLLVAVALMTGSFAGAESGALTILALGLATRQGRQLLRFAGLAGILMSVSASALLVCPFSRQSAAFPKVLRGSEYQFSREAE